MSLRLLRTPFGALQQAAVAPWRAPHAGAASGLAAAGGGPTSGRAVQHADRVADAGSRAHLGTGTRLLMDAYAERRAVEAPTHRQAVLIVLGVLLPTFMGSLDQTILATA